MQRPSFADWWPDAAALAAAAAAFAAERLVPDHEGAGVLYLGAVLLTVLSRRRAMPYLVAAVASLLAAADLLTVLGGSEPAVLPLAAHGLVIAAVWVAAMLAQRYRIARSEVQRHAQWLSEAQHLARAGHWVWEIAPNRLYWSAEIYRIFGVAPGEQEPTYEAFLSRVHPEDREAVRTAVDHSLDEGAPYSVDHRIVLDDGSVRVVHEAGEVICSPEGRPLRMVGTVQDITDQRRQDDALRMHEAALAMAPSAIVLVDPGGRVSYVNQAAMQLLGCATANAAIGGPLSGLCGLSDEAAVMLEAVLRDGRWNGELACRRRDGSPFTVALAANVIRDTAGRLLCIAVSCHDLTELAIQRELLERTVLERTRDLVQTNTSLSAENAQRRKAEAALRESESRFRQLAEHITEVFYVRDVLRDTMLYVSPAYEQIWGRPRQEIYDDSAAWIRAVHPQDADSVRGARDAQLSGEPFDMEYRIVRPDGEIRWIRARSFPVYDEHGRLYRLAGLAEDVTRYKEAEAKHRLLIENAADAILLADENGNLTDANTKAVELLGYSKHEITAMHFTQIHPPAELPRTEAAFRGIVEHGGGQLNDGLVLRRDGCVVPVDIRGAVIEIGGHKIIQGIFRNVAERQREESERLAEAARQRDTLIREVHHRIKNNLQGVIGLMRREIAQYPAARTPLEGAIGHVRSIGIIHGLQGRDSDDRVVLCDLLQSICEAAGTLAETMVLPEVKVEVVRRMRIAPGEAVPVALILNELVTNAVKHSRRPETPVGVSLNGDGRRATVEILSPGARFDPGFDFDAGTGLGTGLSLVRSLLPASGAALCFEQRPPGSVTRLSFAEPIVEPVD